MLPAGSNRNRKRNILPRYRERTALARHTVAIPVFCYASAPASAAATSREEQAYDSRG